MDRSKAYTYAGNGVKKLLEKYPSTFAYLDRLLEAPFEILNKAKQGQELSDEEFLELLNIENDEDLEKLFKIACDIRDNQSKVIKLTSTVHLTNKCQIQPRCEYCGFAEETSEKGYYNAFYKSNDEIIAKL